MNRPPTPAHCHTMPTLKLTISSQDKKRLADVREYLEALTTQMPGYNELDDTGKLILDHLLTAKTRVAAALSHVKGGGK